MCRLRMGVARGSFWPVTDGEPRDPSSVVSVSPSSFGATASLPRASRDPPPPTEPSQASGLSLAGKIRQDREQHGGDASYGVPEWGLERSSPRAIDHDRESCTCKRPHGCEWGRSGVQGSNVSSIMAMAVRNLASPPDRPCLAPALVSESRLQIGWK